jgi:hypothetical protein
MDSLIFFNKIDLKMNKIYHPDQLTYRLAVRKVQRTLKIHHGATAVARNVCIDLSRGLLDAFNGCSQRGVLRSARGHVLEDNFGEQGVALQATAWIVEKIPEIHAAGLGQIASRLMMSCARWVLRQNHKIADAPQETQRSGGRSFFHAQEHTLRMQDSHSKHHTAVKTL